MPEPIKSFEIIVGTKEKGVDQHFHPFSTSVIRLSKTNINTLPHNPDF